jgi:HK97 family phage major capsid protein
MTTKALPKTPAEWEHYLSGLDTPEKFTEAMNDKEGGFKAHLQSYVTAQTADTAELQKAVNAEVQASLTELLKNGGIKAGKTADLSRLNLTSKVPTSKRAPGAGLDGQFLDIGEFVQTVWHREGDKSRMPNAKTLAEKMGIVNAYQEKVPSDGGFLVPEEFRTEIMTIALETAIVRPRAMVIPMGTNTLSFPTVDATSNVSTVFGGIVVYRTEEGEEFVESKAKFGRIKLDVTKQTALAYITNETVKDTGGALTGWLNPNLGAAMGWFEDLDYLSGSGAGEPLGALNAANPALIVVDGESGQAATTILWENVLRMYSRMLPSSLGSAVWVVTQDAFFELATMALNVGTGGSAVWLPDAHGAPQLTLLGRPVIMTEKAPGVLGAKSDISFVDFSKYMIGDRESMSIETSPHVKFTSDQTTIRVIARNDGRPAVLNAITPQNSGPTLSPYVTLAARS